MNSMRQYAKIIVILLVIMGGNSSVLAQEKRKPVIMEGKTFLPLRVLARPFSNIYKEPDGDIATDEVAAFQAFYVYTRPNVSATATTVEGWYEVGSDVRGTVLGWMKAEDVMEWKQTMCLAYTHPGGRKPVLMFDDRVPLRELMNAPQETRLQQAEKYYAAIDSGDIPADFPIISRESNDYIDIVEQFYLLPILEHAPFDINGVEGRLLKVAAATKTERGSATLQSNPEAFTSGTGASSSNPEALLKGFQLDIVYVMDMTNSMQPYIDATLEAVKNIALTITQDADIAGSVKFGLWGYRDSLEIPGIEFVTKNFTPELQSVSNFEPILTTASAASVGSVNYEEDMAAGMDQAMRETKWTENAIHLIILLGDAPSHAPGDKWNSSELSANALRTFANPPNTFWIYAMHIQDQQAQEFWEATEQQFRTLSRNPGIETSSYWSVASTDRTGFANASKQIAESIVNFTKLAKTGNLAAIQAAAAAPSASAPQGEVASQVMKMGYAALVEWIGREKGTQAPRDITAWITDKDILDPDIQAMDVRILISKNELDSLKAVLQEVMVAGRKGQIGGQDFFTALQSIPTVAARNGDQLKNARTIAESGLFPEFMSDLPYQSRIMNMTNELWGSWGEDQQNEFLNDIDTKIKLYAAIHDDSKGWIQLNTQDDPSEYVHPLSLEALP